MNINATAIRNRTLETMDKINDIDKEVAKLRKEQKNYHRETYERLLNELAEKRNRLVLDGATAVQAQVDAIRKSIEKKYALNGSDLHPDAQLLQSGLTLTADDLGKLMDKHASNATMTRLLHQYANNHGINTGRTYTSVENVLSDVDNNFMWFYKNAVERPTYPEWRNAEYYYNSVVPDALKD